MRHLVVLLGLLSTPAFAQLVVEGLQFPVWVERADQRIPLAPGDAVAAGEQIITGDGGKVWVQMPDKARVKLGPEAALNVSAVNVTSTAEAQSTDVLDGALDVIKGAFRYTTGELSKLWQRDLRISLGNTATIGIRGTDLWGQVEGDSQFVVLLEGRISVQPQASAAALTLQNPLEIYRAGASAVDSVDMAAVQALAPITELDSGSGVMRQGGAYQLHLASFSRARHADAMSARLARAGLATRVTQASVDGQDWFRVSVLSLASLEDARALRARLAGQSGVTSAWISRN
jgi:hypothetical protein